MPCAGLLTGRESGAHPVFAEVSNSAKLLCAGSFGAYHSLLTTNHAPHFLSIPSLALLVPFSLFVPLIPCRVLSIFFVSLYFVPFVVGRREPLWLLTVWRSCPQLCFLHAGHSAVRRTQIGIWNIATLYPGSAFCTLVNPLSVGHGRCGVCLSP